MFKTLIGIILIATVNNVSASIKSNLKTLEKDVRLGKSKIKKVASNIKNLEESLDQNNKDFLGNIKKREMIERELTSMKLIYKANNQNVDELKNSIKNELMHIVLRRIEKEIPDLIVKKYYAKSIRSNLIDLNILQEQNIDLGLRLKELNKSFDRHVAVEDSLKNAIDNMENSKLTLTETYLEIAESQSEIVKRWKKEKEIYHKLITSKIDPELADINLDFPLNEKVQFFRDKGGLTLKSAKKSLIRSPASGEVIYIGSLSSLGSIMMIDHGRNMISVLYGSANFTVKKGDLVKRGESLGEISPNGVDHGRLHYEVRKNNLAQDLFEWFNFKLAVKDDAVM